VLSAAAQEVEQKPASDLSLEEPPEEPQHEVADRRSSELDVHSEPEIERTPEPEANSEPAWVDVEPPPIRMQGGLLAALFGRKK
jgi:hypothetical protein